MAGERVGHSLQPTALLNEAYVRLVDGKAVEWHDRAHFLAVAARIMRRILVDHARARSAHKRGGGDARVTFDEALVVTDERPSNLSRHGSMPLPLSEMEEEQMNTGWARVTMTAVLIAVILAASTGCEHQRSPTAPGPPTPAPSTPPSPVPTGNSVPAANNGEVGVYRSDVTMSRSGMATVALRWPNADFSLQLYVTTGACADITSLATGGCAIVGRTRPGDLPGVVTNPVTGGDLNTIWVLNPDPFPQSFTVDVSIE